MTKSRTVVQEILPGSEFGTKGRERSFTWGHLVYRAIWNLVWSLLASWTPPQLYGWRRLLLNLFGAELAPGARVYGSAKIWYPPNLKMGKGAVLGPQTFAYSMEQIILEDYAEVAQFVRLMTGTHDIDSPTFQLYAKPIRVCSHAWIASACFVGPGVTIGEGAVLGGAAVTFSDLAPWTVYVGNPAQPIKQRERFVEAEAAA